MKTNSRYTLASALLCAIGAGALCAAPLDIWTWRNPLPTGNSPKSVAHGVVNGHGLFVAVGPASTILTSPDGAHWEQQVAPPNTSLSAVAFGGSEFVAVGADAATATTNVILTSLDGTNWVSAGAVGTNGLLAVAYGGSGFVAVGNSGVNWHSAAGVWIPGATAATLGTNLNSVAYGNGEFMAVGAHSSIFASTDGGATWSQSLLNGSPNGQNFSGVAHGDGRFVAVGDFSGFYYILDGGGAWTFTTNMYGDSVLFANNEFIVANTVTYYPSIVTSPDGITWAAHPEAPWLFSAMATDGTGTFVGVGASTIATNSTDITLAADWSSAVSSVATSPLIAIASGFTGVGNNLFLASEGGSFGEAGLVFSTNGFEWEATNYAQLYNSFFTGLAYAGHLFGTNEFVATVNTSAGFLGYNSVIMSSSNGLEWTTNYGTPSGGSSLNGIVSGFNAAFVPTCVAVGTHGFVAVSTNLTVWSTNSVSQGALLAVASGGGRFVAVGSSGITAESGDGVSWTTNSDGDVSHANLNSVAYGYGIGKFVAVGSGGAIFLSPDGINWTPQVSGTVNNLSGVAYAKGLFVAVGAGGGLEGTILVSADGVNWRQPYSGTANDLAAVAFGDGQFIVVGASGAILGSVLAAISGGIVNAGAGTFTFAVSGPPGTFGVYVSRDLVTWTWVKNVTFTAGSPSQSVTDSIGNFTHGYYYLGPPPT